MSKQTIAQARKEWKTLNPFQQFAKAFFVGATQFPQTIYSGVEAVITGKDPLKTAQEKLIEREAAAWKRVRGKDYAGFLKEDVLLSPAVTDVIAPLAVVAAAPAIAARVAPAAARIAPALTRSAPAAVRIGATTQKIVRGGKIIAPHVVKYGKPVGKFAAGTGIALAAPEVAKRAVAHPGSPFLHPTIKKAHQDPLYEQAKAYAYQTLIEKQSQDPFYMQMVHALPGGQIISTGDYKKQMRSYYNQMGITDPNRIKTAQKAMEVERNIGGIWEVAGAVSLSAGAETIGQAAVSKQLAKYAGKTLTKKQAAALVTKAAAKGIIPAGFYEGATVEAMQQLYREGKITAFELNMIGPVPIPGGVIGTGALGAGFAGLLGTGIARFSITKPKAGKVLQTFGYAIDPYEYPGDIFARVPQASLGIKGAKLRIKAPVFAEVPAVSGKKKKTISLTKQDKQAAKNMGMTQQEMLDLKRFHTMMQTPTPVQTQIPTVVPTPTFTPTPTDPFTPTPTTEPDTPTPVDPFTPTPTTTPTPATVPVVTPIPRIFPPVPLFPGGGISPGVSRAVGRRTIFYDEPAAAQLIMRSLL